MAAQFSLSLPLPPTIEVGYCIGYEGSLTESIKRNISLATCFQIMMAEGFRIHKIAPSDLLETIKYRKEHPFLCFSHLSFMYNLAGSIKTLAWNGNLAQDRKMATMIRQITEELETFSKLSTGCVLHVGASPDKKRRLDAVATTINKIAFQPKHLLLLENAAGEGNKIGSTLDELAYIYKASKKKNNIGFCLDTCHLFAQGDYDFRDYSEIDRFYSDFDKAIGIEKIKLIHLNDSQGKFGCHLDRHEVLGEGKIWGGKIPALIYFLNKFSEVPMICETDYQSVEVVKKFVT